MKPLVSILIPAYDAEAWISDTLRLAIAQTWERKEITVVDDGSTDRTFAVAQQSESDLDVMGFLAHSYSERCKTAALSAEKL